MKIYKDTTVFEEALIRIRYLFDEFPNVVVGISGGKDSTVVFNLSMMVAKEKNRLPLKVFFLDQEAEYEATIDQVDMIMRDKDVEPLWFQIPFRIINSASKYERYLDIWGEENKDKWLRPKVDISRKENIYGQVDFFPLFPAILAKEFPNEKACYITGQRAEESPSRKMGMTSNLTYKGISWGKILNRAKGHYSFHPIYDWSFLDIWKAIHDNKWPYNKIYDLLYMYGVPLQAMRVSSLHHETSVRALFSLQELEPATYEKLAARMNGIDTAGKLGADFFVKKLPFMFADWAEYRDYLLEKLITSKDWHDSLKNKFEKMDIKYAEMANKQKMYKMQVQSILTNDWELIKIKNWEKSPEVNFFRKWKKYGIYPRDPKYGSFIPTNG